MKPVQQIKETTVYRYVRPLVFSPERNELIHSPAGGISFRFNLNHSLNILHFSYVRCKSDVKFCTDLARKQLANKPKYLIFAVQRNKTLLQNVEDFLIGSKGELKNLRQHLREIQQHNQHVTSEAEKFYSNVTEKVKVEYELT